MLKKILQGMSFLFLLLLGSSSAYAFASLPPDQKPLNIQVGLFIDHILSIDEVTETMHFNAAIVMSWKDKRLAFSKIIAGVDKKDYGTEASRVLLAKIWHPQIDLLDASGPREVRAMNISITSDGVVTWREQFEASTSVLLDLRQFPFDVQDVEIRMQPFIHNAQKVTLSVMKGYTGVDQDAHIQGWEVVSAKAKVALANDEFQPGKFSRYTLTIKYDRLSLYYTYQLLIPIVLIVLLSFSVFWMTHNPLVNLVAISLTAVLTIVVFQWRMLTRLPRVNYHTFADMFMLVSFVVAASTVVASIFLDHQATKKKKLRYAKIFRIVYPVVYVCALAALTLYYYP